MNKEDLAYFQMEGLYEELEGRQEPCTSDTYDDEEAYDN